MSQCHRRGIDVRRENGIDLLLRAGKGREVLNRATQGRDIKKFKAEWFLVRPLRALSHPPIPPQPHLQSVTALPHCTPASSGFPINRYGEEFYDAF